MRLFLLLTLVATTMCAQNTYVVIAPSTIHPNMNFTVSVNILKATGDVTVVAQVLREATLVGSGVNLFKAGIPGTITIKLPSDLPNSGYTLKVVGSGGLVFDKSKSLSYNSKEASLFIQLNKDIFKPSDTVKFRVIGVYSDLQSYKGTMDISIYDAKEIKIKQWVKVSPEKGVIAQELTLSSQPVLGVWKISVEAGKMKEEKSFTVAQYVLPKFKVEVIMPPYVFTWDSDITFTVKAKYAYGKPVKGSANVQVNLHDYWETKPVYTATVPIDGETRVMVPVSKVKEIQGRLNKLTLTTVANVTESLTGIKVSSSETVTIYDSSLKFKFQVENANFKPGLLYPIDIKISQPDGRPIGFTNENVKVKIIGIDSLSSYIDILEQTLSVPSNGLVTLRPQIPSNVEFIHIKAYFRDLYGTGCVAMSHSPSSSYLQIHEHSTSIKAGDTVLFSAEGTEALPTLTYQILSRGNIVKSGTINGNNQKSINFSIVSVPSMAPSAIIVVYYVRPDGEVVPDSISFDISGAFNNKVTVDVDKTNVEPGDEVTIVTTADPDSNVFLLAIDQNDVLVKNGNDVTFADVHTEYVSYNPDVPLRFCRTSSGGELLEDEGVIVLTDANVYQDGLKYDIGEDSLEKAASYRVPRAQSYAAQNAEPQFPKPARVREISPESWLWTDAYVGVNGSASITATVPDTITSWVVSAFAINSNSGLGVAQTQARLKVFRPFFVSLNLPYSVTRGEQLAFQANVFNYLPADMQVRVTLAASKRFHNIFIDATGNQELKQVDVVQDIMVKAGEAKSVYFPIVPADLGRIDVEVKAQSTKAADAVRRQLLVEAEGVPKQYNVPVLIDLRDGKKTFSKTIDLTLPDNVMKGSELVRISAVGDLMGPTIAGLASVLQLPTGCGEQTMLDLAADVYVTDYLDCVNQLNGDVKTKAINFMESGYQGVLTYKHSDGSFSAFGTSDKSGSMWLTAFVARVFHQAKRHIFVDDNIISDAILWMIQHQKTDGSFPEPGVDQAGSGVKLTLFVLISLLENRDDMKFLNVDEAIQKALSYAEQEVAKLDDLYVLAMASYAFQLAGSNMTQAVLDKLEAESTQKYGMKYWHQSDQPKIITSHSPNPTKAVDIEMTAYVLLTYTKRGDLVAGKSIMQWITKQRNANGCFTSTQDTVVALNALSEYSKQTYSNKLKLHITTQLDDESTYTFDINNTNLLLLQSRKNTKVPAQVVITATGSGLALVQAAVSFNVLSDIVPENFNLKLEIVKENLTYLDVETCTRWIGKGTNSAMAVQEFGIPSGFAADLDDLTKLDILKRVETQNKKVILYFDKIGTTPVCLNLRVRRVDFVAKSQPAAVRVYDYYEPRNQVTVFYQSQLLKDSTICDVCRECEKCQPPIEQEELKVFRQFFVSLNLPYSVTRDEQLALQANVFNYLPDDMQVQVTLAKSKRFHNIFIDTTGNQELKQVDVVQDVLVKAGEAKSVYFPIVPADLGRIDVEVKAQSTKAADTVRRQLLVEAEGVPKQYNVPVLIDLTDGKKTFSKTIALTLPNNVVKGSELVRISAVGDLMGPTIAGLGSLLQIPTGCGEQTMLDLAADVYVTDYLDCVNQLNEDIKTKAIDFMESGFQGVLTYKHSDGSFSAFGNRDKSGSMWLTAFVARVFHQAKGHIFVDENILNDAIQWMIQQQNTDGSFPEPGVVLSRTIQDQAGSGVKLTLFVLISLLENLDDMKYLNVDEAIQKALAYAEQEVAKLDDLYVLAMASYAFQLAGSNMTQAVLDKLEAESTQKDGTMYWHQQEPPKVSTDPWHWPNPAKAVDIEMTAYVLLTYTRRGDLLTGKSIMQWITKQRNANGGFISTQDTVVALNALSEYAKQAYSNKLKLHITTQLDPETTYTFDIEETNSLLMQSKENPKVPAQVVIIATGTGMALVQASVNFHVLSEIEAKTFDLKIKIIEETINYLVMETCTRCVCTRWLGNSPNSGMAVQEFGIPSGFDADLESITERDTVKRVETQNKKVILYFDKIGATPVCLNLRVRRVDFVAKSQPAAVRVYDYYEPRNQVTDFYQSQLLKYSTICDVCPKCENCRPVTGNFQILQKTWDECKALFSWFTEIAFDIVHLL